MTDEASLPEDFPYEIFEVHDTVDIDQEFKNSTLFIFEDANGSLTTPINKSIWIMEGNMNYFFSDSAYASEDTLIYTKSSYTFSLNSEDELTNEEIKTQFASEYSNIEDLLSNNANYTHVVTDISVSSITNGSSITLDFITTFQVNAYNSAYTFYPVQSAAVGRYAGISAECGTMNGIGAWEFNQHQARSITPPLPYSHPGQRNPAFNILMINSDPGQLGVTIVDGTWFLGRNNALYSVHDDPVPIQDCISSSQQNNYGQRLADELFDIAQKRTSWDGVYWIRTKRSTGTSVTSYYYNAQFAKMINPTGLTTSDLGI